ncbi:MAG: ribonuclease P protein component [Bacteroidia bacterium]|nr:ribonuclease P protein component [Bacteroidia bacterium]
MYGKTIYVWENERLKSRKRIEQLFGGGKSFVVSPFRVYCLVDVESSTANENKAVLQFGVGASSRNFKRAVDRNRIKRLIKEAWRLQNQALKEKVKSSGKQMNVFIIYTGKELPDFDMIKSKVSVVLKKLIVKPDEDITATP